MTDEMVRAGALTWSDTQERIRAAMTAMIGRLQSPNSRAAYQADWADWTTWLDGRNVLAVEPRLVQAYCDHLSGHGYARQTVARRLNVLRQMYAALVVQGVIATNPAREVKPPVVSSEPKTPWLETDALVKLLNAYPGDEWRETRNRLVLLTFAGMGLRRENIASMRWSNLVRPMGFVVLRATVKGGKSAELRVPDALAVELDRWRNDCLPGDGPVFPAHPKSRDHLTGKTVWQIVKDAATRAGLDESKVTPHALRRTFATLLYLAGEEGSTIQAAMAHAKFSTTERYIKSAQGMKHAPGQAILDALRKKQ